MARVLISFLGTGANSNAPIGYAPARYQFPGAAAPSTESPFVQAAIVEHAGATAFDRVHIGMTPESRARHHAPLLEALRAVGLPTDRLLEFDLPSPEAQTAEDQWRWFEALHDAIAPEDEVEIDFTHGFRSVPVVFSAAISFLQQVRPFRLRHAWYGFYDPRGPGSMTDLAPFYEINRWAAAIDAFARAADAEPLAEVAGTSASPTFAALRDERLLEALRDLTSAIKDVDINGVSRRTEAALAVVSEKLGDPTLPAPAAQILGRVVDTFAPLAASVGGGGLDDAFFEGQLQLAGLLVDHGLHMQALTAMRECIGSIGVLGTRSKYRSAARASGKGRSARRYADVFVSMCKFHRSDWVFTGEQDRLYAELLPLWERLDEAGITDRLHELTEPLVELRNDLAHGWTSRRVASPTVARESRAHLDALRQIVELARAAGVISR
jgi:CRISPR-associated Csx2 family protein